jgi:hypothetical protein
MNKEIQIPIMSTKTIISILTAFLFLFILSTESRAQKQLSTDKPLKRQTVAKLLVELDKVAFGTNNNNGRSNRDRCCQTPPISVPSDYDALAFDVNSQWVLWQEGQENVAIPNPIPYLKSIATTWNVYLYNDQGVYQADKSAYITGFELIISISDLPDGGYFIEIEHGEEFYRTGFRLGPDDTPPLQNIRKQN